MAALRSVNESDAHLLTGIHRQCFPHYWNTDAFNDFFAVRGTQGLLAQMPEPAGMAIYRIQHEQAEIITLAVLPHYRRLGLARLLLENALRHAADAGAIAMFLDVEEGNEAALALYQHFDFTVINRRKHYYRQKDGSYTDALVMRVKLG